jgi:DNA modification methylase
MEINRILLGNCQKVLGDLPDSSFDLVVTDPPYGYSFMGKDWDKAVPSVGIWKECLRVLKHGAFAFIMSSPRADVLSRMIVNLGDAGFRTDFTPIYWAYASGFPKAMNVSKMVDKKRIGERNGKAKEFSEFIKTRREELVLSKTELDNQVCNGSSMYSFYEGRINENGYWSVYIPSKIRYEKMKELLKLDDSFDDFVLNTKNVIGKKEGDFGYQDGDRWNNDYEITVPKSDEAKLLDGSYGGFQPKPAVEVIIVAMKPLSEKTFVDQALKNGHGLTWLDDARIPFQNESDQAKAQEIGFKDAGLAPDKGWNNHNMVRSKENYDCSKGRFPANLLVSDDCLNDGSTHKSGTIEPHHLIDKQKTTEIYGEYENLPAGQQTTYGDSGSFSRYFSLDAWFEKQFKKLPLEVQRTFPFLIEPKASKAERNEGLEKTCGHLKYSDYGFSARIENGVATNNRTNEQAKMSKNFHPTVKPLQLMSYLITLGSRTGDLVLDPFAGSGTTCLAAKMLGRQFLGIEIKKEYVALAESRVGNHRTLFEFTAPDAIV